MAVKLESQFTEGADQDSPFHHLLSRIIGFAPTYRARKRYLPVSHLSPPSLGDRQRLSSQHVGGSLYSPDQGETLAPQ